MQDKGITDELRHRGTNDCVLNVIVLDSDFYSFEYLDAEDIYNSCGREHSMFLDFIHNLMNSR